MKARTYDERYRPESIIYSVPLISFSALAARGIRHAIFDVDGTVIQGNHSILNLDAEYAIKQALADGHLQSIGFLSNTITKDRKRISRVTSIAQRFAAQYHCCCFHERKPHSLGFIRLMNKMGSLVTITNTVMIGDQLFTDIAGAKRLSMPSIFILNNLGGDCFYTSLRRNYERSILQRYDAKRLIEAKNHYIQSLPFTSQEEDFDKVEAMEAFIKEWDTQYCSAPAL